MITINPNFPGFKSFFKNLLTIYQREADTYKDVNKEGLFERYMAIFGEHIDNEFSSQIENYLDVIDANVCDEKFLTHLSDVLGNPPDIFKNVEQYRNLLSYIVSVYKVKGTTKGYKLFFYIFGFDVTIIETEPIAVSNIYDDGNVYDDTKIYEPDTCARCSTYTISIKQIIDNGFVIDSTTLALLRDAITFNEPINAVLANFTIVTLIEDDLGSISIGDTQTEGIHSTDVTLQLDTISNISVAEEVVTTLTSTSSAPVISLEWNDTLDTVDKVCNLEGCPYTIKFNYSDADNDLVSVSSEYSADGGITWLLQDANMLDNNVPYNTIRTIIIHTTADTMYRAIATDSLGHQTISNTLRAYSTYTPPPQEPTFEILEISAPNNIERTLRYLITGTPNELINMNVILDNGNNGIDIFNYYVPETGITTNLDKITLNSDYTIALPASGVLQAIITLKCYAPTQGDNSVSGSFLFSSYDDPSHSQLLPDGTFVIVSDTTFSSAPQ